MIEVEKNMCCGCSACVQICPKQCISFIEDEEGFLYPKIEKNLCVQCGLCKKVCPFQVAAPVRNHIPEAYGMKALDNQIVENSSSGGVFSLLAGKFIETGGVVYGAAMTDDMRGARHIRISTAEELSLLRGSKYLQSEMKDCYRQIKEDLNRGKKVLFSGVPCQIDGLKLYLNNSYENLICVEVICHGVPSPLLWKKYVENLETRFGAKISSVNFRKKKHSWNKFGLLVKGENISQFKSLDQDSYLQLFLKNYCLRPSCYTCNAKYIESMADITIADFWGVQNVVPEMDDDKGTSLVLIQSCKGKELFERVKGLAIYKLVDFDKSIQSNPAYYKSALKPKERDVFFEELNTYGYNCVARKYGHLTPKEKLIKFLSKTPILKIYRNYVRGG